MATSVATPLERRLGTIARRQRDHVGELRAARPASRCSSTSTATSTAPRATCRRRSTRRASTCRPRCAATRPTARSTRPTAPVMILALTSTTRTPGQIYDAVSNIVQQQLAQVPGVGDVEIGGGSLPAVRVELHAVRAQPLRRQHSRTCAPRSRRQRQPAEGRDRGRRASGCRSTRRRQRAARAATTATWSVAWRNGAAVRLQRRRRTSSTASRTSTRWASSTASRRSSCWSRASPAPTSSRPSTRVRALLPELAGAAARRHRARRSRRPHASRSARRCTRSRSR